MAGYEAFWGNEDLSDVMIVLYEEAEGDSRQRKRDTPLPAHRVVLAANSQVLQAQVVSWAKAVGTDAAHGTEQPHIDFAVPAGQLEIGESLLKAMYQQQPDLSGLGQVALLQLLTLADRYQVPKVVSAVNQKVQAIATTEISWDLVSAVVQLPSTCKGIEAFATVVQIPELKLQTELGDLELVWADGVKQQQFLALPFAAVHQLLSSQLTKVTSENTVAHTIICWAEQHDPSQEQLQDLVSLVRMRHCTLPYLTTVISSSSCFTRCHDTAELQLAALCCSMSADSIATMVKQQQPVLVKFPAWAADKRPASAMAKLKMVWYVPLTDVQASFNCAQEGLQSLGNVDNKKQARAWQGYDWYMSLELTNDGQVVQDEKKQVKVGLFLRCRAATGTVAEATFCLQAEQTQVQTQVPVVPLGAYVGPPRQVPVAGHAAPPFGGPFGGFGQPAGGFAPALGFGFVAPTVRPEVTATHVFVGSQGWGSRDLFGLGAVGDWATMEGKLRSKSVVHADGCLHLMGEVTAIR